jgi:hypothetical protein
MSFDKEIIPMVTIGKEHEGAVVTVVGILSHKKQHEDGSWSAWLQDGLAVEIFLDAETYARHASYLFAAAVLVRGRAEWREWGEAAPDSWAMQLTLQVESVEPRKLLSIQTEEY